MPKSFLVKTASRGKWKGDTEPDSEGNSDDRGDGEGETHPAVTDDVAIQCNLPPGLEGPAAHGRSFGGNGPAYHHRYDTHNLHTLAELCLKRADLEYAQLQSSSTFASKPRVKFMVDAGTACSSQTLPEAKKEETQGVRISTKRNLVKKEVDREPEIRNATSYDKKRSQANTTKKEPRSRLNKLEEELEKMLQGKEEIISREIKEFLDNNKPIVKNALRETGVTQAEMSKFLLEGVHLKDDKRQAFYRWYLENKLNNMDPDDESFTCYKCGKIFAYESYLERHVKYVCPDKTGRTWKCSYCSKAFQYPCYLRRHMRSHTGESPYKCTQCSRAFVRSTDLQRHLRNHTGEKPYKCKECSRAFARSTDLKRHNRTHTGEKPYKCWQCSKAFSQSGSLQTHLHTHYKESLQIKGGMADKSKMTNRT